MGPGRYHCPFGQVLTLCFAVLWWVFCLACIRSAESFLPKKTFVLEQEIEGLQKTRKFPIQTNHFHYWVVKFGSFLQIILQMLQSSHIKIYTDRPYISWIMWKLLASKTTVLHQCHHQQAAKSKFNVEIKPLKMKKTVSDPSTHLWWLQAGSRTESHVWSAFVRE